MRRTAQVWPELAGRERRVLDRSPLVLAICKVDFPRKINATSSSVAGEFQNLIDEKYPVPDQQNLEGWEFSGTVGQPPIAKNLPPEIALQFTSIDGNWMVSLTTESVSLECREYSDFEDFLLRMEEVVDACIETVKPRLVSRIGLRYINELRAQTIPALKGYINEKMLGAMTIPAFANALNTSIQTLELAPTDIGARVNLNHGIFPRGTTVNQPGVDDKILSSPFYLLDIDVYHDFRLQHAMPKIESSNVSAAIQQSHDIISNIFWWSVTEKFVSSAAGE